MRLLNAILVSAAVILGATASDYALARGGHGGGGGHFRGGHVGGFHSGARIGIIVGAPLLAPWYAYAPLPYYYDYPPVYALPTAPPAHYEQMPAQTAPAQQPSFWYYCSSSKSYYPYVKECPEGWQRVAPKPPPQT